MRRFLKNHFNSTSKQTEIYPKKKEEKNQKKK